MVTLPKKETDNSGAASRMERPYLSALVITTNPIPGNVALRIINCDLEYATQYSRQRGMPEISGNLVRCTFPCGDPSNVHFQSSPDDRATDHPGHLERYGSSQHVSKGS